MYFGHFLMHRVRAPLAQPLEGRRTGEVIKTEEKGSDVNLAVHLLNDGWLDAYDCSALPKKETVRKYRFANAVVASSRSEAARREPVPVAAVGIAPTLGSPKDYKLAVRVFKGHAALELLDAAEAAKAAAEEAAKRRPGESRVFDGMEFVWVPSGEFRMGSTSEEAHDSGWARGPQLPQGAFSIHRA